MSWTAAALVGSTVVHSTRSLFETIQQKGLVATYKQYSCQRTGLLLIPYKSNSLVRRWLAYSLKSCSQSVEMSTDESTRNAIATRTSGPSSLAAGLDVAVASFTPWFIWYYKQRRRLRGGSSREQVRRMHGVKGRQVSANDSCISRSHSRMQLGKTNVFCRRSTSS